MQLEHGVPGALAFAARAAAQPHAVETGELLRLRNVGRLARFAAGLVVLAEFRPLQLRLAGRGKLVGARVRRGEAVLDAAPYRHHRFAGEDAHAEGLALRGLAEELDADLAPGLADELQDVGVLGALPCGLDDELER